MKTKGSALLADLLLVALILGGALWLLLSGQTPAAWTTDQQMLPLSVDWSRILLVLTAAGVVLGIALAAVLRRRADRVVDGEAIRYDGYQRLVHWALAIGFILDFATAAWLLRWLGLPNSEELRPTLYLIHFIGASLIVFAAASFVTSSRVQGQDALFPRWRDLSPAIARLFGYLGIYGGSGALGLRMPKSWQPAWQRALGAIGIKPVAREGKFLAVEKVFSFTPLALLSLVVVGTGLIKAGRYFFVVPPEVLSWSTWLHGLSTWGVLIIVGADLAAIVLVPRNWPGIRAMVTGRIGLHHVREEFPAWADELGQPADRPPAREGLPAHGTVGD